MKTLSLLIALTSPFAHAAPYPVTSSSVVIETARSNFFHGFGFRMPVADAAWAPVPVIGESSQDTVRFEPKADAGEASVSIRMDRLPENSTLESYAKKWMRDYPSYGFEVLGTKNLQVGGGKALLVDMLQKAKGRQLRQIILQKNEKVAVLTCLDKKEKFNDTLQTCNRMIRGFEWADETRPLSKPSTTITR